MGQCISYLYILRRHLTVREI